MQPPVTRPADPSPVPACDDAPPEVLSIEWGRYGGMGWTMFGWVAGAAYETPDGDRAVTYTRVPSPDVLRAECEALESCLRILAGNGQHLSVRARALRGLLTRQRALLAAVTRDGEAP
jgi:hypothetical protein